MINMHIRVMHNLNRLLPASLRARCVRGLFGREHHLVRLHGWVPADAEEVDAQELRRLASRAYLAEGLGEDGAFEGYGAVADVIVGDLALLVTWWEKRERERRKRYGTCASLQTPWIVFTKALSPRAASPFSRRISVCIC